MTNLQGKLTQEKFDLLKNKWRSDTSFESRTGVINKHSSLLEIVSYGKEALPFIFGSIPKKECNWLGALSMIVGENSPKFPQNQIKISERHEIWLKWGKDKGYA
jgi:hypothetical protein